MSKIISRETTKKSGHTDEVSEAMLRIWEGLEVADANFDLVVHLADVDFIRARARDMFECAFVLAVRRLYDSKHAIFTRTLAYVDIVMDGEKRKVYRFRLSEQAKRIIKAFDKIKTPEDRAKLAAGAGANFVLRAPSPSQTFIERSKQQKKQTERRRILIKGTATCKGTSKIRTARKAKERKADKQLKKQAKIERGFLELSDIRKATGLIKFQVGKIRPSSAQGE